MWTLACIFFFLLFGGLACMVPSLLRAKDPDQRILGKILIAVICGYLYACFRGITAPNEPVLPFFADQPPHKAKPKSGLPPSSQKIASAKIHPQKSHSNIQTNSVSEINDTQMVAKKVDGEPSADEANKSPKEEPNSQSDKDVFVNEPSGETERSGGEGPEFALPPMQKDEINQMTGRPDVASMISNMGSWEITLEREARSHAEQGHTRWIRGYIAWLKKREQVQKEQFPKVERDILNRGIVLQDMAEHRRQMQERDAETMRKYGHGAATE